MSRRFSLLALLGCGRRGRRRRSRLLGQRTERDGGRHTAPVVVVRPASSTRGPARPDYIVPSDLPLQGAIRHQTVQISRAMIWALAQQGWKAGPYKIGYQSCDDSTAQTGGWDTAKCATNARLYASNRSVIGVARNVQLRLRQDHRADPQPCAASAWSARPTRTPASRRSGIRASRTSTTRPARATTPASSRLTTSRARRTRCGRSRSASRRSSC